MTNEMFKKEAFKKSVKDNVKFLYRKTIEEATQEQIFQAVSYTVKDVIIDNWLETQKAYDEQEPKTVYYMSMEFLMGRALGNNLINLCAYGEVKEALDELGFDLNCIEDQEPDPALGNGGLGRLAACFLDSLIKLLCIWMRNPLSLRNVQTENRKRLPDRSTGQLVKERLPIRTSPSGICQRSTLRRICKSRIRS